MEDFDDGSAIEELSSAVVFDFGSYSDSLISARYDLSPCSAAGSEIDIASCSRELGLMSFSAFLFDPVLAAWASVFPAAFVVGLFVTLPCGLWIVARISFSAGLVGDELTKAVIMCSVVGSTAPSATPDVFCAILVLGCPGWFGALASNSLPESMSKGATA